MPIPILVDRSSIRIQEKINLRGENGVSAYDSGPALSLQRIFFIFFFEFGQKNIFFRLRIQSLVYRSAIKIKEKQVLGLLLELG